jgi:hypothetical protein
VDAGVLNAGARSLGRRGGVLLAAGVALAACGGPSDLVIGGVKAGSTAMVYLSPAGSDDNDGVHSPWLTFRHALPLLQPGSTLILLDGTYSDVAKTGYLNVVCGGASPSFANAVPAANGTVAAPITVRAANERAALLDGAATGPPVSIDGCSFWTFDGLFVKSSDSMYTSSSTPDAGSVIVVGEDNHDLTFSHMLAQHPNRWVHSHVIRIDDRSTDITVEDSELYEFHHNALETSRTTGVKLLRNYINSRATADLPPPAYQSEDATEGDYGILLEETNGALVANNVIESVSVGVGVVGRYQQVPAGTPAVEITDNDVLGNVVLDPGDYGLRIDSRCNENTPTGDIPCTNVATKVTNTLVSNDAFIGGAAGISSAGAIHTVIQEVSVINAANGLRLAKEPQNAGLQSTSATSNTFADVQDVAFYDDGEATWSFDDCAAVSANPPDHDYQPDDGSVTHPIPVDSTTKFGSCLVYIPTGSPLEGVGAGGQDVGANVVTQYDDEGQATAIPLWNATTGVLSSCGAVVMNVNKDLGASSDQDPHSTSCLGVQRRLNVGTNGCPLP